MPGCFPMLGLMVLLASIAAEPAMVLRPDRVFDGSGAAREGWVVVIEGERIAAAGPAETVRAPAGATDLPLPGCTLLPGLIDAHTHLLLFPYSETPWDDQVSRLPLAERVCRAAVHARANLMSGFTTIRDMGTEGADLADVGVKSAIAKRVIQGPEMVVTTRAIVATGSYAPRSFSPEWRIPQGADEADGERLREVVRRQIRAGADWIKVYADTPHGPGSAFRPAFSQSELDLIVSTARDAGVLVAAHAQSREGMRRAAMAGVATIEHGDEGDLAVFRLLAEKKIGYCPTMAMSEAYARYAGWKPGAPTPRDIERKRESFKAALESGVAIVNGSDMGVFPHGDGARELELLVRHGMKPASALEAATAAAARMLRMEERVGSIKKGLRANLLAVRGNPLENISAIRNVRLVVMAGAVVRRAD